MDLRHLRAGIETRCRVTADSGVIVDDHESSGPIWVDRARIENLLRTGAIPGALTAVALLHLLMAD